jgi:hypothetical protein
MRRPSHRAHSQCPTLPRPPPQGYLEAKTKRMDHMIDQAYWSKATGGAGAAAAAAVTKAAAAAGEAAAVRAADGGSSGGGDTNGAPGSS